MLDARTTQHATESLRQHDGDVFASVRHWLAIGEQEPEYNESLAGYTNTGVRAWTVLMHLLNRELKRNREEVDMLALYIESHTEHWCYRKRIDLHEAGLLPAIAHAPGRWRFIQKMTNVVSLGDETREHLNWFNKQSKQVELDFSGVRCLILAPAFTGSFLNTILSHVYLGEDPALETIVLNGRTVGLAYPQICEHDIFDNQYVRRAKCVDVGTCQVLPFSNRAYEPRANWDLPPWQRLIRALEGDDIEAAVPSDVQFSGKLYMDKGSMALKAWREWTEFFGDRLSDKRWYQTPLTPKTTTL